MRAMPTQVQSSLNPNDFSQAGSPGFKKKQFENVNQHYIHHNAVLPTAGMNEITEAQRQGPPPQHFQKDPYANMPVKPNQMTLHNSNQLQK